MAVQNRSNLISHSFKVLKKHYQPVPPPQGRSVLEHLLFGICLEGTPYDVAERAFANIRQLSYDWNEVRVTSVAELAESFKGAPHPAKSASNFKRALHSVFETRYSYDLDSLAKQNLGKAIKELTKHPGATSFAISYLTQHGLGGHSIPLDDAAIEIMYIVGIIDEKEKAKRVVPGLERAIPKSKGIEYGSLLHGFVADFVASPLSPKVRAILLELNPDCKERLPKRRSKKQVAEEKAKTAGAKGKSSDKSSTKAVARKAESKPPKKVAKKTPAKPAKKSAGKKSAKKEAAKPKKKAAKKPAKKAGKKAAKKRITRKKPK